MIKKLNIKKDSYEKLKNNQIYVKFLFIVESIIMLIILVILIIIKMMDRYEIERIFYVFSVVFIITGLFRVI